MSNEWQTLIPTLEKAIDRLTSVLKKKKDEYIRDSAIQRFEFTFELVWKSLKAYLEAQGVKVYSPRDSLRAAFQVGLIGGNPRWLKTIKLRNLISHTYSEKTAEEIYKALPAVLVLYKGLLVELKRRGSLAN